jgi:ferredoxin
MIDIKVDYESLTKAGCIMGSGGMIIMDEDTCMVEVARYFLAFTQEESCGKCVPCRIGTKRMLERLTTICEGEGEEEDIDFLEEIALSIKDSSLCQLGQTAPNPVLTTLRYFRDEYKAHIEEKRCPAGVCKALIRYEIIPDNCVGCGACKRVCPSDAITGEKKEIHLIHQDKCIKCGMCYITCRYDAIQVV